MSILVPAPNGKGMINRFVKGESGNPSGRKSLGASVVEWVNSLSHRGYDERKLRRIAKNRYANCNMRLAAKRLLRMMEDPDMADFEDLLDGQKSLKELRGDGIDTRVVKKCKTKTRHIQQGDGDPIVEVEREIELHDRSGEEFDRILDRTDGKANQTIQVDSNLTQIQRIEVSFVGSHLAASGAGVPVPVDATVLPVDGDRGTTRDRQELGDSQAAGGLGNDLPDMPHRSPSEIPVRPDEINPPNA